MSIKACIEKITPKWAFLRRLRTNRLVSSTYIWLIIVPAAAKATSGLEGSLEFITNGILHSINLNLPFSWQIFFLSALSFVVANILFLMAAPRFIQLYGDYGEFIKTGGLPRHLEAHKAEAQKTLDTTLKRMQELAGIEPSESNPEEYAKELFWTLHETYNDLCLTGRAIAALFYLVGFILFIWVASQNVAWALSAIFF